MIRQFKKIRKEDLPIAGGKGCNLGELTNAGFNVPAGFIVTTTAFFQFLEKNSLSQAISEKLRALQVGNTEKLDTASHNIRKMILDGTVEEELLHDINNFIASHGADRFAVRSSATAEDLPTASFAGQQDTYLNVEKNKIVEHIKKCWASLFTSRAIYYRDHHNIKGLVGMAVVVQKMVDADFAGVMFTLDPVFKKDILIEAAFGLGEKIVSGSITPNNYFLDRKTLHIKQKQEHEDIDNELIKEVAKIGLKIEKHYGSKQDVEFAVKGGIVYILQARPITA